MPRKKQTNRGKYARHPEPSADEAALQTPQSRLLCSKDDAEQRQLITAAVESLYPFSPHEKQVDCVQRLLYRKEDLILVARTSFGKSLIMQILPCLVPNSVIIVILPLLALGLEQAESIQKRLSKEIGANPIFVNAKNISQDLLMHIKAGVYTHTLISPELLTGRQFRHILRDPQFRNMVKWVVIDELHLVSVWGNFENLMHYWRLFTILLDINPGLVAPRRLMRRHGVEFDSLLDSENAHILSVHQLIVPMLP
jgi:hypothetical protein